MSDTLLDLLCNSCQMAFGPKQHTTTCYRCQTKIHAKKSCAIMQPESGHFFCTNCYATVAWCALGTHITDTDSLVTCLAGDCGEIIPACVLHSHPSIGSTALYCVDHQAELIECAVNGCMQHGLEDEMPYCSNCDLYHCPPHHPETQPGVENYCLVCRGSQPQHAIETVPWKERGHKVHIGDLTVHGATCERAMVYWGFDARTVDIARDAADFYLYEYIAAGGLADQPVLSDEQRLLHQIVLDRRAALHEHVAHVLSAYLDMVIGGELRHHPSVRNYLPYGGRSQAWVAWQAIRNALGVAALEDAIAIFEDWPDGTSIGGTKWAQCTRVLYLYETHVIDATTFIDRVFDLEHNGGAVLNKVRWKNNTMHFIKAVIGDLHGRNEPGWFLCSFASAPARKLWSEWVRACTANAVRYQQDPRAVRMHDGPFMHGALVYKYARFYGSETITIPEWKAWLAYAKRICADIARLGRMLDTHATNSSCTATQMARRIEGAPYQDVNEYRQMLIGIAFARVKDVAPQWPNTIQGPGLRYITKHGLTIDDATKTLVPASEALLAEAAEHGGLTRDQIKHAQHKEPTNPLVFTAATSSTYATTSWQEF